MPPARRASAGSSYTPRYLASARTSLGCQDVIDAVIKDVDSLPTIDFTAVKDVDWAGRSFGPLRGVLVVSGRRGHHRQHESVSQSMHKLTSA